MSFDLREMEEELGEITSSFPSTILDDRNKYQITEVERIKKIIRE